MIVKNGGMVATVWAEDAVLAYMAYAAAVSCWLRMDGMGGEHPVLGDGVERGDPEPGA